MNKEQKEANRKELVIAIIRATKKIRYGIDALQWDISKPVLVVYGNGKTPDFKLVFKPKGVVYVVPLDKPVWTSVCKSTYWDFTLLAKDLVGTMKRSQINSGWRI